MRGVVQVSNLIISPIVTLLKDIATHFEHISLQHIFCDFNTKENSLSKEGILLLENSFGWVEEDGEHKVAA
jgi:hypothetical protein